MMLVGRWGEGRWEIAVVGNKSDQEIQTLLKTPKGPWETFMNWKEYIWGKAKSLEDKIHMFLLLLWVITEWSLYKDLLINHFYTSGGFWVVQEG